MILSIFYIILCVLYVIIYINERNNSTFLKKEVKRLISERDVMMKYFLSDLYIKKINIEDYEEAAKIDKLLKTLYP